MHYYNGVDAVRTTICSVFVMLGLSLSAWGAAGQEGAPHPAKPAPSIESRLLNFPLTGAWAAILPSPPAARPGFDAVHAYIPLRNGELIAASLDDGSVRWKAALSTAARLATGGGLVFVAGDGSIEARWSSDGSVRWRALVGGKISAPLVWDTDWLIVGTETGELVALRGTDGEILWRRAVQSVARSPVALAADRLYASLEDGRVVALGLRDGQPIWERKLGGAPVDILALEDRLFVGSKDNFFYCLDTRKGKIKWRWRTGADVVGRAVVDEKRVYFVSLDNLLRALDRGNGVLKWQRPLPFRGSAGPLLVGDLVLVAGVEAAFRAYRADDGEPAGEFVAPADLAAPPHFAAAHKTLVILTLDGRLEALGHAEKNPPAEAEPRRPPVTIEADGLESRGNR